MWRKDDEDEKDEKKATESDAPRNGQDRQSEAPSPRPEAGGSRQATIGPSISVKGDVTGEEDLLIQGEVHGLVNLEHQSVTVGSEGRVKADITAQMVTIEGRVEGDLTAAEQVILRSAAHVQGDITAPRVVLEDGASYKGLVDMSKPSSTDQSDDVGGASGSSSRSGTPMGSRKSGSSGGVSSSGSTSGSGKSSESTSKAGKSSDEKEKAAS